MQSSSPSPTNDHHTYVPWKSPSPSTSTSATTNHNPTDPRNLWWSSEFHRLILNISREPREEDWRGLKKLSSDFTYAATAYGRIIIEEIFLPTNEKTITPLCTSWGGFAGGMKYLVRGILFKFSQINTTAGAPQDSEEDPATAAASCLYENADAAAKVSGHELRACSTIISLALDSHNPSTTILPPLQALIDYRGYRLLAVSLLPIHPHHTLVYGSANGGETIVNNHTDFYTSLVTLATKLNLAQHESKSRNVQLCTGADVEGHVAGGLFYLIDLHRIFPCEAPPFSIDNNVTVEEPDIPIPQGVVLNTTELDLEREESYEFSPKAEAVSHYLVRQLRPTALQKYGKPLSSDAFSPFADPQSNETQKMNEEIQQCTRFIKTELIGQAVTWLSHRPEDAADFPHRFKPQEFLHERGINVRNLNLIYSKLPHESPWRFVIKVEMCARAFKTLVRRRWRATARKSKDTSRPSHDDYHDVVLKAFDLLLMTFHSQQQQQQQPSVMETTCVYFWWKLCVIMREKFGLQRHGMQMLSPELISPSELRDSILKRQGGGGEVLLERCIQLLGLELTSHKWIPVTLESPFSSTERLKPITPSVKVPSLIEWAEANCLRINAQRQRNVLACEMLRRAKTKIEEVSRNVFLTSRLMCDLAEINYDSGIRIEPERLGYEFADEPLRNLARAEQAFRWIVSRGILSSNNNNNNLAPSAYDVSVEYRVAKDDSVNRVVHAKRWARVLCRQYNDLSLRGSIDMMADMSAIAINSFFIMVSPKPLQQLLVCYSTLKNAVLWSVEVDIGEKLGFVQGKHLCCNVGNRVIRRNVTDGRLVSTVVNDDTIVCMCIMYPIVGFEDIGLVFVLTCDKIHVLKWVGKTSPQTVVAMEDCGLGSDVTVTSCTSHVDSSSLVVAYSNGVIRVYAVSVQRSDVDDGRMLVNLSLESSFGGSLSLSVLPQCMATNTFVVASSAAAAANMLNSPRLASPPPSSWSKIMAKRYRRASAALLFPKPQVIVGRNEQQMASDTSPRTPAATPSPVRPSSSSNMGISTPQDTTTTTVPRPRRTSTNNNNNNNNTETWRDRRSSVGSRDSIDSSNAAWNSAVYHLRVAVGMSDSTVITYDATTGNKEHVLNGHLGAVLSLVFDDGEKNLLFSSSADCQVRVWNVELGACLRVLAGHPNAAYRVFYSAHQQRSWSLSSDGIREWRFDRLTVLGVTGLYQAQSPAMVDGDAGMNSRFMLLDGPTTLRDGLSSSTAHATVGGDGHGWWWWWSGRGKGRRRLFSGCMMTTG